MNPFVGVDFRPWWAYPQAFSVICAAIALVVVCFGVFAYRKFRVAKN
jgi:hypothetical protein